MVVNVLCWWPPRNKSSRTMFWTFLWLSTTTYSCEMRSKKNRSPHLTNAWNITYYIKLGLIWPVSATFGWGAGRISKSTRDKWIHVSWRLSQPLKVQTQNVSRLCVIEVGKEESNGVLAYKTTNGDTSWELFFTWKLLNNCNLVKSNLNKGCNSLITNDT